MTNINLLLKRVGHPEKKFPSVLIAGTNGKGSTAIFLSEILKKAGYKTGLYTSPHLIKVEERVKVNGKPIPGEKFVELVNLLKPLIEDLSSFPPHKITFFEAITALSFLYFSQEKVDILVSEVGMGGRLDATNTLSPLLGIITPISREHTTYLGNNLPSIAKEKCGIIKEGMAVISSPQKPSVNKVIRKFCRQKRARLCRVDKDLSYQDLGFDGTFQKIQVSSSLYNFSELKIRPLGKFQIMNALTALLAAEAFFLPVSGVREKVQQAIKVGLEETEIPGRLQIISRKPLVIFDVAHNPEAIASLISSLSFIFPEKNYHFLLGLLKDKDAGKIIKTLSSSASSFVFTRPETERAQDPDFLAKLAHRYCNTVPTNVIPRPKEAFSFAKRNLLSNGLLCICGSFYLSSAVLKNLTFKKI